MMVHRTTCRHARRTRNPQPVARASSLESQELQDIVLRVEAEDRKGLWRDVTGVIAEADINIVDTKQRQAAEQVILTLSLKIGSLEQLSRILQRLIRIPDVTIAQREKPQSGG